MHTETQALMCLQRSPERHTGKRRCPYARVLLHDWCRQKPSFPVVVGRLWTQIYSPPVYSPRDDCEERLGREQDLFFAFDPADIVEIIFFRWPEASTGRNMDTRTGVWARCVCTWANCRWSEDTLVHGNDLLTHVTRNNSNNNNKENVQNVNR